MPFGRSILQKKSMLRVSEEERSTEILISFHSSGSTSIQWRKLKNPWFPGRTQFRPSCFGTGKEEVFCTACSQNRGSGGELAIQSCELIETEIGKRDTKGEE